LSGQTNLSIATWSSGIHSRLIEFQTAPVRGQRSALHSKHATRRCLSPPDIAVIGDTLKETHNYPFVRAVMMCDMQNLLILGMYESISAPPDILQILQMLAAFIRKGLFPNYLFSPNCVRYLGPNLLVDIAPNPCLVVVYCSFEPCQVPIEASPTAEGHTGPVNSESALLQEDSAKLLEFAVSGQPSLPPAGWAGPSLSHTISMTCASSDADVDFSECDG
jgi:hypothetical protein